MCKIHFTPISLERQNSRFYVELNLLFLCSTIDQNASLVFTPVLTNRDQNLELPSILITGCKRYYAFKWLRWLLGHNFLHAYKIKKILKAGVPFIAYPYRTYIDYEEWMSEASVRFC